MISNQGLQSRPGYQGTQSLAGYQGTQPVAGYQGTQPQQTPGVPPAVPTSQAGYTFYPMQIAYPVNLCPVQPLDPSAPPPSYREVTSGQYSVPPSGSYQPE